MPLHLKWHIWMLVYIPVVNIMQWSGKSKSIVRFFFQFFFKTENHSVWQSMYTNKYQTKISENIFFYKRFKTTYFFYKVKDLFFSWKLRLVKHILWIEPGSLNPGSFVLNKLRPPLNSCKELMSSYSIKYWFLNKTQVCA